MPLEVLPNDPAPSVQSGFSAEPSIFKAQFGKGYTQSTGEGPVDSLLLDWPVVWNNISKAKCGELHAFFKRHGGWMKFRWTPLAPHDADGEKTYVCEKWQGQYLGGDVMSMSATLMERPPL